MQNVFSIPLIVDDISIAEKKYNVSATKEELQYLQEALKVPGVKELKATLWTKLSRKEHLLEVWGNIKVTLELESVISLELFNKKYSISFESAYDTKMTRKEQKELEEIKDNVPEIILGGKIDLVDIIIEQIAINIEDHPRKEGEDFNFKPNFDENEPIRKNPFEILSKLKK